MASEVASEKSKWKDAKAMKELNEAIEKIRNTDPKVFRDPWTRYLGYGFAVGTVLPPSLRKTKVLLTLSSLGFVAADVSLRNKNKKDEDKHKGVLSAVAWQGMATLFLPAVVAQGAKGVATLLTKGMVCKLPSSRFDAAAITVLSLPIFSVPIDKGVNYLLGEEKK